MDRRGFLSAILAAGVAPALVKAANIMPVFARRESGMLVPSEQFVVTEIYGANMLLTPSMVTREALRILQAQLTFGARVGSDSTAAFRVGDVVTFER